MENGGFLLTLLAPFHFYELFPAPVHPDKPRGGPIRKSIQTRLGRARVAAGLTQVEFSKITGISIDQIRHFERGGRTMTSFAIAMFAQTLGVSAAWLAGIGDENEPLR